MPGTPHRIRTDLSATLFFTNPDEYDGGELLIEDTYGVHSVKLPAGHLVLYPSTSLHNVRPVTRGARVASFFWLQSMIRDDGQRTLLFDMDTAIQRISRDVPDHPSAVQLTGVYHNLLQAVGGAVAGLRTVTEGRYGLTRASKTKGRGWQMPPAPFVFS